MKTSILDPTSNRMLAALPGGDLERWLPHLEAVTLRVGEVLYESGRAPLYAYFPVSAVISLLVPTHDGRCDEVCVAGREGAVGVEWCMGAGTPTARAVVQSAGRAYRVRAAWIREEFQHSVYGMHLLLRYALARSGELAQGIVCSRHHTMEQRLSRRLLQAMDRHQVDKFSGPNELQLTQEQLGGLLGARRESITDEALKLQRSGVIRYSRGRITVLDRAALERRSCECYALANTQYQRLTTAQPPVPPHMHGAGADLASHLQSVREEERADLARELHDELGSLLTRAKLDLATLKLQLNGGPHDTDQRIAHLGEMINMGIAFSRRVVEGLYPSTLQNLGLAASLINLAHEFQAGSGIATEIRVDETQLDTVTQLTIYRLVQEALNNVSKHAAARSVGIAVVNWETEMVVAVRDDGRGFETRGAGSRSHGLASMRHRVEACAGQLTLSSSADAGTVVVAVFPRSRSAEVPASPKPVLTFPSKDSALPNCRYPGSATALMAQQPSACYS